MNVDNYKDLIRSAITPKKFSLIILPTMRCNFNCYYCYESHNAIDMSESVIKSIKELVYHKCNTINLLEINWFGGEPLCNYKVITDLNTFFSDVCSNNDVTLSQFIITNGYLLSEKRIRELDNISRTYYQITLDGDREAHNKTRVLKNGSGTFDRIIENLMVFNDLYNSGEIKNSNIGIRLHMHKNNIDAVYRMVEFIVENFNHQVFSCSIENITKLGGKNDNQLELISRQDLNKEVEKIRKILQAHGFSVHNSPYHICYAAYPNSYVIMPDGHIKKCTVDLNTDRNNVGQLLPDGRMQLDAEKLNYWFRGLTRMDAETLSCPAHTEP